MFKKYYAIFITLILLFGCDHPASVTSQTMLQPENFALNMIPGLIRSGLTDAAALEQKVNDPNSGINNVDVDRDGRTDYVMVKEGMDGANRTLTFVAHPSGNNSPDVPFAVSTFTQGAGDVQMQTGFLPVVNNYGSHYYQDSFARDMAFATWLYMASRPVYVPYVPRSYSYHSVRTPSAFVATQRTYQSQTKVSPVVSQPRPSSFNPGNSYAIKAPAATPARTPSNSLSGATNGMKNFQSNNSNRPSASGFGASTPSKSLSPSTPSRSFSQSTPSRSYSSPSRSYSSPSFSSGRKR
jgi:hypothetical protein